VCSNMEALDGAGKFSMDAWTREGHGSGFGGLYKLPFDP
jgi:coproporphyrinogen III oxidase